MWVQYDHLIAHSRGGDHDLTNMVVTCAPCNYGRMQYTLEEAYLFNPLEREPRQGTWDGLERMLTL
jgi:5-methylcytosine-specific restriction endonuclease McrA